MVSKSYWVTRPTNLTSNPSNLAPLLVLYSTGPTDPDTAGFRTNSVTDKYVVLTIAPTHSGQYAAPTTSPNPTGVGAQNCGVSGTNTCDDSPWIQAVLQRIICAGASPCENIDPDRVYAAGGSKVGQHHTGSICDTRTTDLLHGSVRYERSPDLTVAFQQPGRCGVLSRAARHE